MKQFHWCVLGAVVTTAIVAAVLGLGPTVSGQQIRRRRSRSAAPPAVAPPLVPPVGLPQALPPQASPTPVLPPQSLPSQAPSSKSPGLEPIDLPRPEGKQAAEPPPLALPVLKQESFSTVTPKGALGSELRLGRQEPAVSIEWSGPPMVRLNQPMTCQLVVRNTSGVAVHNVVVRHRPSQGVTYRASEPQPTVDEGDLVWSLGSLAAGQVRRIDLQMVVQVKGPLTCQATVTFSGGASHQVQVSEPQLKVRLKGPDRVLSGEMVTLLYTVSNPGDGPAEGVKLRTILPEGLEHQHGRAIEVDLGTLASKESRTLQLVCLVRRRRAAVPGDRDGRGWSQLGRRAAAGGHFAEARPAHGRPEAALHRSQGDVRLQGDESGQRGGDERCGARPGARDLQVSGHVGQRCLRRGDADRHLGGRRSAAGSDAKVALDMVPTAPGNHKVTVLVSSCGLKTEAETRTLVEGLPALLIEVSDTDDPVEVGAETTYEIRVANTGTKTETNVQVVCTLPEQVDFRSAKGGTNLHHSIEGREVSFEPVAKLAPRADVVYRIQVRGKLAGDVRFRVRVRADGLSEPILREESTRFYNDDTLAK